MILFIITYTVHHNIHYIIYYIEILILYNWLFMPWKWFGPSKHILHNRIFSTFYGNTTYYITRPMFYNRLNMH